MKFEAAALFGVGEDLRSVEVTLGEIRPDEVLVRILAAGVCHTDLSLREGVYPAPLPIILGHEGSGIVERVGSDVVGLAPGDAVVLTFMSCGTCRPCADGRPAHCISFGPLNISGVRGDGSTGLCCDGLSIGGHFFGQSSFARYAIANRRNTVKVRADAPIEMLGPFGCGIQTGAGALFNALRPEAGSSCVVFGAGGVGLSAVMAAGILACAPIIVVETRAERRALALELGATLALDPADGDDLAGRVMAATGGGAQAIVETTGIANIVTQAAAALGRGGKLGLIGMSDMQARAEFSVLDLIGKAASIQGIIEGDSEPHAFIPYLIDLFMEGRFPVDKLLTFFDFKDVNEALAAQANGRVIKAVLKA